MDWRFCSTGVISSVHTLSSRSMNLGNATRCRAAIQAIRYQGFPGSPSPGSQMARARREGRSIARLCSISSNSTILCLEREKTAVSRVDHIQLLYDLTFQTPFHCGTGLRSGLIDRTIVRDAEGYLYVPGSTIKGALRMHCEGLSRLYELVDEEMRERIDSPHNMKKALWGMGNRITMITRIFGARNHPGHLFFDDAGQAEQDKRQYDSRERDGKGKYQSLQTDLYTQVRLDRPTRTAVAGALYTSEFGIKGFSFKGSITGWLECLPI